PLSYEDINDVVPDGMAGSAMDELISKLRALEVEITDDREPEKPEELETDSSSGEALDDPVRMYMNQMGKVPLLSREQEVELCKRIETAESEVKALLYGFGFAAKEHCALADKLLG